MVLGTVLTGATVKGVVAVEHAELRRHLAGVPGWLSDEEAVALYELAKDCTGRGVIVEIGSFKGRSTICLGLGSRPVAASRSMRSTPGTAGSASPSSTRTSGGRASSGS